MDRIRPGQPNPTTEVIMRDRNRELDLANQVPCVPAGGDAAAGVWCAYKKTRLSGYNPGIVCASCERALFAERELGGAADGRPDLAAWVWDTEPMRCALARLDFPAVLVIYRSAARLSRRELSEITGLSHSAIWYYE